MISFTAILWNLSGPLDIFVSGRASARRCSGSGIVYVLFASMSRSGSAGRSSGCRFDNEKFNAAFRYALVRLRDASESVAFYRGEIVERTGLRTVRTDRRQLQAVRQQDDRVLRMEPVDEPDHRPLPYVLQFPRFFTGEIQLGDDDAVRRRPSAASRTAVVLP